ncbi:Ig-like domain-containing protein [Zhihengliuella halotolerans]|uniref:Fibronectin type III domain protein n=1 Tax=Zhihengliuella halotolerans TaxID=370736 RepID=A0A4Q8AE12_9MICC|nr:Ig-like domain-containing protein [Zhihengliuella halotolerans]RZU62021.1 fibronectin type III domain protein [Zhihengliuella halotolerans]
MAKAPRAGWPTALKSTGFKATAVSAAAALAVTGAILYPGFETADVELNDGGVWVVNQAEGKIGHINYQSRVIDGGVVTPLSSYDLVQNAESVFVRNLEQASLTTIDPAMVQFAGDNNLPANSSFSFGTSVVAVTDDKHGTVQAAGVENLSDFSGDVAEPLVDSKGDVDAVVGVDDTVWTVDYDAGVLASFAFDDSGEVQPQDEIEIADLKQLAEPQLTAVGETGVVFDAASGDVFTSEGKRASVENPANARLQAPGPKNDGVAIALDNSLATVGLNGRDVNYEQLDTAGTPIEPVRVGSCTYAAWQTSGQYLRYCDDSGQNQNVLVPEMPEGAELVFRVNRDVVVLNDIASGQVWLTNEGMEIVSNWSDLEPPAGEGEAKEEETKEITDAIELPNRTEENQTPIAEDDTFSVRPGRTTMLPVLYNDVDPDGDLLTAEVEGSGPSIGDLQPVHNGTGFQVVVPEDASGAATFVYTASDGRGGSDSATVRLNVVGEDANEPPEQERVTVLRVQQGESVSQNLLTDWTDPEGDDLQLLGGTSEGDDVIRVRPDGSLTFQDDGKRVGQKEIAVQVSDGRESTKGRVLVEVLAESTIPPITATDHVVGHVGESITFEPLANDTDPSGEGLRLANVDDVSGLEMKTNTETGAVTVTGERAGTYYAKYVATNGPASAPGLVRIDINEPDDAEQRPIAVRDVALLPAGQDVLVDVLGNDTDPSGGVLVVTAAENDPEAPFSTSVERNTFVRITDVRGLTDPTTISYTVANGNGESTGEIRIVPIPAPPRMDPPQANPDSVVVREHDVATVKVLENDIHPNGGELTLLPELEETDDLGEGSLISVADDVVRFRAGDFGGKARQVSAVYKVAGPDGQETSATVTFNVKPAAGEADLESNTPPNPVPVEGRVFAGSSTNVQVPLEAIDPDGDSVSLVQFGSSPKYGTAKIRGASIDYTANRDASGTDEFTYVVEDRLGARSTATVKIGIAPLSEANNPPVAVNDLITVRPDRPVAVDVMANDTDPDGDPLALMRELGSEENETDAEVVDGRVVLMSPPDDGTTSVRYSITDGRGGTASATLTVKSDPEAKLLAPIARDDRVSLEEIIDVDEVTVDILRNDEDPDGSVSELEVHLPDDPDTASVNEDGMVVQIGSAPQVIAYTLTDPDGLTSTAFVHVPGTGEARPILRSDVQLEVTAGETLSIDLEEIVLVRDGRSPRLTTEDSVSSMPENDGALVKSATELTFKAGRSFSGSASVTFEVTDGSGPDDDRGLTSTLTVPINVLPSPGNDPDEEREGQGPEGDPEEDEEQSDPENFPPTLQANSISVGQGEGPAIMDLRMAANDRNDEDVPNLKFALGAVEVAGVEAAIVDGYNLRLVAPADTPKGTRGTVTVSVSDGVNPPVSAAMTVTVTGSTRELPVAVADNVPEAAQGQTEIVDALANDHNPYQGEGDLRLISARPLENTGTAEVRGNKVAITPRSDFVGTMRVEYVIGDVTEDPQRNVSGTITLNVKGAPAAPNLPRVESTGDRKAVLTWDPPANNGSAITHYTVTGGGHSQQCETTTCTITPLTNDQTYNFTVTASNAIGESPKSPESADARPDVEPEQPAAPTGKDGDQKATFNWTAPVSRGSAIQSYTLEISPAPANGVAQITGITGTSYTWEGLKNGTAYQVRVRAVNKAAKPSQWSTYSAAVTPAGVPFKPDAPTAVRKDSAVDGGVVDVSWRAPGANGAPLQTYTVRVFEGSSLVRTISDIPANRSNQTVTGLNTSKSYRFSVTARNRVGASDQSAQSAAVTPYGRPTTIGKVTAKATGANRMVELNFTAPGANGSPITGYQYSADGGAWKGFGGPGAVIDTGSNGDPHTWRVRAVNAAGPANPSAPSNSTSAYGPLRDNPQISASHGNDWIKFTWNTGAGTYNGRKVTQTVTIGGNQTPNDGAQTVNGLGYSTSRTIKIVATDTEGQRKTWSKTEKTNPKPQRKVSLSKGDLNNSYTGCNSRCYTFHVRIENFNPGTYRVDCYNQNGKFNGYPHTMTAGNDGRGFKNVQCVNQEGYAMPVYAIVDGTRSNDARW